MASKGSTQIVITGAGLATPLGLTRESTWAAIRAGACGLGPLSAMEQPLPSGSTGGQAPDLPESFAPHQPREVRYLRLVIAEALAHAGFRPGFYSPDRCGFMLGTTLHGMRAGGQFLRSRDPEHLAKFLAGGTLAAAAEGIDFRGFAATGCSACSSSLGAIALAVSMLRAGTLDLAVAGGYDTISEYVYGGFNSLRLVAAGPLRPFTRNRQGMKLAEGYGLIVLERAESAARRGARPLARILGYGESADSHHLTQPHPEGEGAARAMRGALDDSGLAPADIDLIAAHATGTPDNDAGEYAALSRVFGAELPRVPVIAFKSHLGHTLGGAGAVELVLSALSLRDGVIPACVNVKPEDLEFPDLNVSCGQPRSAPLRATLNTSLGFGGANTCMILAHPAENSSLIAEGGSPGSASLPAAEKDVFAKRPPSPRRPVFITGVGVVLPGMIGNDAFAAALAQSPFDPLSRDTGSIAEKDYIHLLNARRVRRMSDYVKLSLAAAMVACRHAGIDDIPAFSATCSALLGSTHGSANYSETYYRQIVEEGVLAANPSLFAEGVPNAAAAHLSLMLSLKGPCQTVIGTRTAGIDALNLAASRIAGGEWDRAVVGAAEEFSPVVNAAYSHFGLSSGGADPSAPLKKGRGFVIGCGAITFILESPSSMQSRGARPLGQIVGGWGPRPVHDWRQARRVARKECEAGAHPAAILTSDNGTWLDRFQRLALPKSTAAPIVSLWGHVAETFSVTPLAAAAAVLLCRGLPVATHSDRLTKDLSGAYEILAADYTRLLSSVRVELL